MSRSRPFVAALALVAALAALPAATACTSTTEPRGSIQPTDHAAGPSIPVHPPIAAPATARPIQPGAPLFGLTGAVGLSVLDIGPGDCNDCHPWQPPPGDTIPGPTWCEATQTWMIDGTQCPTGGETDDPLGDSLERQLFR